MKTLLTLVTLFFGYSSIVLADYKVLSFLLETESYSLQTVEGTFPTIDSIEDSSEKIVVKRINTWWRLQQIEKDPRITEEKARYAIKKEATNLCKGTRGAKMAVVLNFHYTQTSSSMVRDQLEGLAGGWLSCLDSRYQALEFRK